MTSESLADDARPSGNPRRPAPTSAGSDPSLPGSAATTTMAPSRARHRTNRRGDGARSPTRERDERQQLERDVRREERGDRARVVGGVHLDDVAPDDLHAA